VFVWLANEVMIANFSPNRPPLFLDDMLYPDMPIRKRLQGDDDGDDGDDDEVEIKTNARAIPFYSLFIIYPKISTR
jgi:hypothetical protein